MTRIAPRELLGLTVEEYQAAEFIGLSDIDDRPRRYPLADEVLDHMLTMIIAEQVKFEEETGRRVTLPRRRPRSKRSRSADA